MIWPNIWRQELFVCQAFGIIIAERGRMDFAGWGVVFACLAAVLIHALGRMFTTGNGRKEN
jgi:hypothetical protein